MKTNKNSDKFTLCCTLVE